MIEQEPTTIELLKMLCTVLEGPIDVSPEKAVKVIKTAIAELTALRKERGRAKEALCNIGPQDSHEDIRVWVGTALAALSEELDAIRPETNFEPQAEQEDGE